LTLPLIRYNFTVHNIYLLEIIKQKTTNKMKKILTILSVAVLLTSCDNGENCEATEGGHIDSTCVEVCVDTVATTSVTTPTETSVTE
jgi:hypothetical protein